MLPMTQVDGITSISTRGEDGELRFLVVHKQDGFVTDDKLKEMQPVTLAAVAP